VWLIIVKEMPFMDQFELITLDSRAREFLNLDV
jgi:hypothetical protein